MLFGEWFAARDRARAKEQQLQVDQAMFEEMVSRCLARMRWSNSRESSGAQDLEDRMDQDRQQPQPPAQPGPGPGQP
jgi:hypothetical protein